MPKLTTGPLAHIANASLQLPPGHPVREACRLELWRLRDELLTPEEVAAAIGCSTRHMRRILLRHGVRRFAERVSPVVRQIEREPKPAGPPHPPQRWCSCEWCVKDRRAA